MLVDVAGSVGGPGGELLLEPGETLVEGGEVGGEEEEEVTLGMEDGVDVFLCGQVMLA